MACFLDESFRLEAEEKIRERKDDFDGVTRLPRGLEDCSKLPDLTRAILERGYSEVDVRKILGGNLLRVFREVQMAAGKGD